LDLEHNYADRFSSHA